MGQRAAAVLTNGTDAGAATTVGDAKGLVQVQMAHISTNSAGACEAHLRIHVGAIHVHLASSSMHQINDFLDTLLEYTKGGGVCDLKAGGISR